MSTGQQTPGKRDKHADQIDISDLTSFEVTSNDYLDAAQKVVANPKDQAARETLRKRLQGATFDDHEDQRKKGLKILDDIDATLGEDTPTSDIKKTEVYHTSGDSDEASDDTGSEKDILLSSVPSPSPADFEDIPETIAGDATDFLEVSEEVSKKTDSLGARRKTTEFLDVSESDKRSKAKSDTPKGRSLPPPQKEVSNKVLLDSILDMLNSLDAVSESVKYLMNNPDDNKSCGKKVLAKLTKTSSVVMQMNTEMLEMRRDMSRCQGV